MYDANKALYPYKSKQLSNNNLYVVAIDTILLYICTKLA